MGAISRSRADGHFWSAPWRLALLTLLAAAGVHAAEPAPEPPATAQAAAQVEHPDGLRSRLLRDEPSPVRSLDPAIFTELSPVAASDPAVRLPEDQREGEWEAGEDADPTP